MDRTVRKTLTDFRDLRNKLAALRQRLTTTLAMETILKETSGQISAAATGGTEYLVTLGGSDVAAGVSASSVLAAAAVMRVKAAAYGAPNPFVTKLKMVCTVITGNTDPATTYTFKLRKADFAGGVLTPGTVVGTLAVTPAGTNVPTTLELNDIALPADGQYVITCTPSGAPAANAGIVGKVHRYAT